MKATLLLGAILLISLVMANDQNKPEDHKKSISKRSKSNIDFKPLNDRIRPGSAFHPLENIDFKPLNDRIKTDSAFHPLENIDFKPLNDRIRPGSAFHPLEVSRATPEAQSTGIMVSGSPVFFLLPLMWLVVHLLHI